MSIEIKKVTCRKELKAFIMFPYELYKGSENWVPALMGDEFDTFNFIPEEYYPASAVHVSQIDIYAVTLDTEASSLEFRFISGVESIDQ